MKKALALTISLIMCLITFSSCEAGELLSGSLSIEYKTENGKLTVIKVPDNSTLPEIVIPDEHEGVPVTKIADFAAVNLEHVTKITIGKNVEEISLWAFENNRKVTAFEVDDANPFFTDIDGVLYTKDMKTLLFYPHARGLEDMSTPDGKTEKGISYDVPEGVEVIRTKAFYKCSELRKISLPSTLESIEEKAFFRCNIDEILLPEGLEFIGKDAFGYCQQIKKITIPSTVEEIGEYAFFNCKNLLEVNVEAKENEMTLGKSWYPTDNGLDIKELVISFAE
ncbi:MAG: leucine-rich repeat domain-containing protein [Ruminococcaceae bacterium]|nr:leucine-rich repeat domain-containing protein [Oscillospiraceae bacterium]MBR3596538.1 leucine-rich repeat domain-containing protein [Clostridia bacterium]